ncbi:hypothetical protein ACHAXH_000566, partial [Discostella pseudostelligera]
FDCFTSQYKNRLFTIIIRGCRFHGSFIIIFKHSMTPSISRLPLTSMQITEGADPTMHCSHRVRMEDMSLGCNTSPRANLHLGYLFMIFHMQICMMYAFRRKYCFEK